MKVIVRGKNKFEPSDAIRNYAFNKMQRMNVYFTKHDDITANVLCKVYDDHQVVEITIPTKHIILRAEVRAQTVYGAIDLAIDKLEGQVVKHKSKIYNSIKKREGIGKYYAENTEFDLEALKAEVKATNLVKSKTVELEPMTPDDAIMQMEMLGHDFFIFLNSLTNKTCVVYLREDEDYGIIETK